jgi:hypothetical protein
MMGINKLRLFQLDLLSVFIEYLVYKNNLNMDIAANKTGVFCI